jgi:hypothetical protein
VCTALFAAAILVSPAVGSAIEPDASSTTITGATPDAVALYRV